MISQPKSGAVAFLRLSVPFSWNSTNSAIIISLRIKYTQSRK